MKRRVMTLERWMIRGSRDKGNRGITMSEKKNYTNKALAH